MHRRGKKSRYYGNQYTFIPHFEVVKMIHIHIHLFIPHSCSFQTAQPEMEDLKDPERAPPAEEMEGSPRDVEDARKGDAEPEGGEQGATVGDQKKPHVTESQHVDDAAAHDKDKTTAAADFKEREGKSEHKNGEAEKDEDKLEEVKNGETRSDGEKIKEENSREEQTKPADQTKDAEVKDGADKTPKGADEKKQVKEVDVGAKDKEKSVDVEKKGKSKKKSGPPSSSVPRPRPTARSIRAAAKKDIIAKFQQGAPE